MSWLNGKKTFIISAFMAMASLVNLITGDLSLVAFVSSDAILTLFEAFVFAILRTGIQQSQEAVTRQIVKNIHFPHHLTKKPFQKYRAGF